MHTEHAQHVALDNLIANRNTDIYNLHIFSSTQKDHTHTQMNDNINMDSIMIMINLRKLVRDLKT
jgi:hypothetical protein